MVQQLGQFLNLQAGSIEEYQEFLSEVLQAEWESNSDPAVVYPILQRGQHLLDDTFAQLLQQWARNVFSQGKPEEVAAIVGVIQNLCVDIQNFPLGSWANNLEIAITGYQTLLEVYTRQAFPEKWARIQAFKNVPIPKTPKKVKSFVCAMSYYRKFIPKFAELAKPLMDLSSLHPTQFKWLPIHQQSFDNMIRAIEINTSLNCFSPLVCRTSCLPSGAEEACRSSISPGCDPVMGDNRAKQ